MKLSEFFALHPKCAIAFSGGVDSTYLLYAAVQSGAKVKAYYVQSAFQPRFEREDALHLAESLSITIKILSVDVLNCDTITRNPKNRCYYCKKKIFSAISQQAETDGYHILLDGTNASDDAGDRPGMQALRELSVLSPLRICGLTKEEIRARSKEAGLFTWDKPAYACLATRIPTGEAITAEKLHRTEQAENYLFSLGFRDFRVRSSGDAAKVQLPADQFEPFIRQRIAICKELRPLYSAVTLDLEARDE